MEAKRRLSTTTAALSMLLLTVVLMNFPAAQACPSDGPSAGAVFSIGSSTTALRACRFCGAWPSACGAAPRLGPSVRSSVIATKGIRGCLTVRNACPSANVVAVWLRVDLGTALVPPISLYTHLPLSSPTRRPNSARIHPNTPPERRKHRPRSPASPTIRRLTRLLSSLTVGSTPGTASSLSKRPIRASFILIRSRSSLRIASTVSCRWIRRSRRVASEVDRGDLLDERADYVGSVGRLYLSGGGGFAVGEVDGDGGWWGIGLDYGNFGSFGWGVRGGVVILESVGD
ncbi:BCL-2-associated athanogene 5 [Actinidia rufa]|uniref:BCL-2-associated athanogene 5 n=1 Tax=Actinidia rufa TaxID=165716 RepID=A0A7J0F157_9ERIC|nr:BCL-2-associated athanogene 5 [Actinidia rufa]